MTTRPHISRFTPSVMSAETLEALFVQRHELATDTVARIRESAQKHNHHQLLFVGPRGCGKTHFVSLIYHRLRSLAELASTLRIAWLTEGETATSFLDLQLRVHAALARAYPAEFPVEPLERIHDLAATDAAEQVSGLILSGLRDRTGLIIVENLDQLFEDIGREGQHRWRAFLQESSRFAILATAQQLFPGVSSRDEPFFGSFQISYFDSLSHGEGVELLANIASLREDTVLLDFLYSPRGRARVRALQHLSGGNHRVYVILSEFIERDSLEDLIAPFERTLDELTPYYQERLRWLSAPQRKVVEHLCSARRPVSVRDIARALFSTNQIVASQLRVLKARRYVQATTRGRESLYELTEPLMRMALELKEHRGGPIRLVVDFLRVWYDRDHLESRLCQLPAASTLERLHVSEALQRYEEGEDTHLARAEILAALGRWDEGWRGLEDCLRRADLQATNAPSPAGFIRAVFQSSHDAPVWRARVERLVTLYAAAPLALAVLGDSLVRSLRELVGSPLSSEMLLAWGDAWQAAGKSHEGLTVALGLFHVGLGYVVSEDPKSLLDLPMEQRAVLQQLFGVRADSPGS